MSFGSGSSSSSSSKAHLPTSARFRIPAPGGVSGQLCQATGLEEPDLQPGFPAAFRPPAFASWASCSRQGIGPSSPPAYRPTQAAHRTLTGFPRSTCMRHDRVGCPLNPEASGVPTADLSSPAAACRSSAARPCTSMFIPSIEALIDEASTGIQDRSPFRSSPCPRSRMERKRFGFSPELRTPQLPATHVRVGTGPRTLAGSYASNMTLVLQSV